MNTNNAKRIVDDVASGNAVLLDVRTKKEWDAGHAARAILLDVNDIINGKLPAVPKNKPIYAYCRAGVRAGRATRLLRQHGYDAQNIGGLDDWAKAGGPVSHD